MIHRNTESALPFQGLLDELASLYGNDVKFVYDANQSAIIVMDGEMNLGSVRAQGAAHTIIWGVLSLMERRG